MDEKAQMLQYVGPGRPWYRQGMPEGVEVSYVLNETGRGTWRASWLLEVRESPRHRFEAGTHQQFDKRNEAVDYLSRRYDEPMEYLEVYNRRK